MKELILKNLQAHQDLLDNLKLNLYSDIAQCAQLMIDVISAGKTIYWCGNGGSAADAEHLSAELVGRYNQDRRALSSVSLTTNTSTITAISNDYGYEYVFSRQVEGLVNTGDLIVGISTSGNSANIENAIKTAKKLGCTTVCLVGREGGSLAKICDVVLNVEGSDTGRIQEMHILVGHILCEAIELYVAQGSSL